jgi:hypothetical protein
MFGIPLARALMAGQSNALNLLHSGTVLLLCLGMACVFFWGALSIDVGLRSVLVDSEGIAVERVDGLTKYWWRNLRQIGSGGTDSIRLLFSDGSRVLVPRAFLRPVIGLVRDQYLPGQAGSKSYKALYVKLTFFQLALGVILFVLPAFLVPGAPRRWAPMIAGVLFLTAMPWAFIGLHVGVYRIGLMRYRRWRIRERGRRTRRLTSGE